MYDIAIIGGGFSGTALAVQLLRRARGRPLKLALIERHGEAGRGVAYGTVSPAHVLNVPAGRMSLLPDLPDDFLRYVQEQDATATPGSFQHRSLYGAYLAARLREAEAGAGSAVLTRFDATALDVMEGRVVLADGRSLQAMRTVLATGNAPPRELPATQDLGEDPRYIRDPWDLGA